MAKSVLVSVLILLVAALFESAILSNISFLPAVPDLVLLCSIYLSLVNGRGYGVSTGFISGLFCDFMSACPFGLNCLLRSILGYFPGFFEGSINFTGFFIPAAFGLVGTLCKALCIWIISLFFTSVQTYNIISLSFVVELVLNTLLAPLIFKLLHSFIRTISLSDGDI